MRNNRSTHHISVNNQTKSSFANHLISQVDLFGQLPTFQILKRQKFSTSIGLFFSLGIAVLSTLYLVIQVSELLSRNAPKVIVSELQSLSSQPFRLDPHNFTLGIVVTNIQQSALTTLDKYFTIELLNCNRTRSVNSTTGKPEITQQCTNYPLQSCQIDKHFQQQHQQDYFKNYDLRHVYCINHDMWLNRSLFLQGTVQADIYQSIIISVRLCQNSTTRKSCASLEESKAAIQSGYYAVYLSDQLVKMDKPGNPNEDIISLQFAPISSASSKQYTSFMKIVETQTDTGFIGQTLTKDVGLVQSVIKENQEAYNGQYLMLHNIALDFRKNYYQRSYAKLQDILGNMGGLFQVLVLCCGFIVQPFTMMLMNLSMANRLFRFEQPDQPERMNVKASAYKGDANSSEMRSQHQSIKSQKDLTSFLKQRQKSLQLGVRQIFSLLLGCRNVEKKQIQYATQKIMSKLDVTFIVSKLYEIEKLKQVLLTPDQLDVFNYLPKPLIPSELFEANFEFKVNELQKVQQYNFILSEERSDQQNLQRALSGFCNLMKQRHRSFVDSNLLSMLDDEISLLFQSLYSNQRQMDQIFSIKTIQIQGSDILDSPKSIADEDQENVKINRIPELHMPSSERD